MSVCLCVCICLQMITFEQIDIFGTLVSHYNIQVKFEYEGHILKVYAMAVKNSHFLFLADNF